MNEKELWKEFCEKKNVDIDTPYEAWAFGGADDKEIDELTRLVVTGKKFGTASALDIYELEDALDEVPKVGDYSVILNSRDEAVCVIRDTEVYVRDFCEVPPYHAYSEGEGDGSLEYWRQVHRKFFEEEFKGTDLKVIDKTRVICEKFSLEYVPGQEEDEDELIFLETSMNYAKEIAAYRQEMLDADSSFDGCFSMKRMPDVQEYVDYCLGWANPSRPADKHGAWGTVLLTIRKSDGRMVGCMQVHNVLSERMAKYTGHVGYSVRPSERRKGYGKRMLAKACDYLKSFGFKEAYVSCLPENIGSKKIILANGAEYVDTVYLEEEQVNLERYRIGLDN